MGNDIELNDSTVDEQIRQLREFKRQQLVKKRESFTIDMLYEGELSGLKAFVKMHGAKPSGYPLSAIRQYTEFIQVVFDAYKAGADAEKSFKYLLYASDRLDKNAGDLLLANPLKVQNEEAFSIDSRCNVAENELWEMKYPQVKEVCDEKLTLLINGLNDAIEERHFCKIREYCMRIENLISLYAMFYRDRGKK